MANVPGGAVGDCEQGAARGLDADPRRHLGDDGDRVGGRGGYGFDAHQVLENIASNPLPYLLAFGGAVIWAIYSVLILQILMKK